MNLDNFRRSHESNIKYIYNMVNIPVLNDYVYQNISKYSEDELQDIVATVAAELDKRKTKSEKEFNNDDTP
jgi:hypothetical protein